MKKKLLLFSALVFLAFGCNKAVTTPAATSVSKTAGQEQSKPAPVVSEIAPMVNTVAGTENWKLYTSTQYEFSFKYPPSYSVVSKLDAKYSGLKTVVALEDAKTDGLIYVNIDGKRFTPERIAKDYVVNGPDAATKKVFGTNTWYAYSGGGGGVTYSDFYYFNLDGNLLQIDFDGPYANTTNHPLNPGGFEEKLMASFKSN
jgi:hypothetical protein